MKIALPARNPELYSHKRPVDAARERGHEIEIIEFIEKNAKPNKTKTRGKG